MLEDIHNNDPDLASKMTWSIKLVENIYHDEFRYHGPFTVFLPTDFGFRTIYRKMDVRNSRSIASFEINVWLKFTVISTNQGILIHAWLMLF